MSLTRFFCLALLATVAAAQEPLLAPRGETLAGFTVEAHHDRIRNGGPAQLAASVAQFRRDLQVVNMHWIRLFRAEHVAVLDRFYSSALVDKQRAAYRKTDGKDADVTCVVKAVTPEGAAKARANLSWTRRDANTGALVTRDLLLTMAKAGAVWRVTALHEKDGDGWRESRLGVPPKDAPVAVPAAEASDRTTAAAAIASLDRAMRRLAALGDRARRQLHRHHGDFVRRLYGGAADARPARPAPPATRLELSKPRARIGDVMRIEAVLTEAVPGTDERSAIARVAFDLKPGKAGWTVVGELTQPRADAPFQPADGNFAMLLIVSRLR